MMDKYNLYKMKKLKLQKDPKKVTLLQIKMITKKMTTEKIINKSDNENIISTETNG